MKIKTILIIAVVALAVSSPVFGGENKDKAGEPIQHQEKYSGVRYTYMEPFPVRLIASEEYRVLKFYFRGEDFKLDDVNLETVRVSGNIPPYTGPVTREGAWLVTDCFTVRFLGANGFRPIPLEGIESTYTVSFDLYNGEHIEISGDFELEVKPGDVNLDGVVCISDVTFMAEYLWNGGETSTLFGESLYELMDLDRDGDIDEDDADVLIEMAQLR